MRTTVTLDDDVFQAAQHLARSSGERLGRVLSDLARRGLRPAPALTRRRRSAPCFTVPADAPIIPASRVHELLDEDDTL